MQARMVGVVVALAMLAGAATSAYGQGQAIDGIIEGLVRSAEGGTPLPGATPSFLGPRLRTPRS